MLTFKKAQHKIWSDDKRQSGCCQVSGQQHQVCFSFKWNARVCLTSIPQVSQRNWSVPFALLFTHQAPSQLVEGTCVPICPRMGQRACEGNSGASTALTTSLVTKSNNLWGPHWSLRSNMRPHGYPKLSQQYTCFWSHLTPTAGHNGDSRRGLVQQLGNGRPWLPYMGSTATETTKLKIF